MGIIIDENYEGIIKEGTSYLIDLDIYEPNASIEIRIPVFVKSIVCKWLEVGKSLKVFGVRTLKYANIAFCKYNVVITSSVIKIGCKTYSVEEWRNFTDREISKMDIGALDWWNAHKKSIFDIHANLPEIFK